MKQRGSYDWLVGHSSYDDGCKPRTIESGKLYDIINNNRYNANPPQYACKQCKTFDRLSGSYIFFDPRKKTFLQSHPNILKTHSKRVKESMTSR